MFADEAGCMEFARKPQASRYFIICTVHVEDCSIGTDLLELRRTLAWEGLNVDAEHFHASKDPESVRNRVYEPIERKSFRIDATLLEKSKVFPNVRANRFAFYKHAWYMHFRHCGRAIANGGDDLLIQAASIGTKRERHVFREAINEVAQQVLQGVRWQTTFWSASSDPCIQVADYCAWAIQRAYERGDKRRLQQIEHNLASCHDLYASSNDHFY
ncbi:MAG TPA: DUF3800 domain-containing protein [Luteibacter sp.]|uniref:DUF3800 domain-containing protein n=1 Tax=Luteibacter sp. TaxID=1886636 RepID=UPI002F40A2F4